MAQVSSRVKINQAAIKRLNQAAIRALEQTAEWIHTEVVQAQVMPRDSGAMQNESTFVDCSNSSNGKVSLVTSTPYARRWYFNPESVKFHTDKNANAQDHWLTDWTDGGKNVNQVTKTFAELYRRNAGT